MQHGPMPDVSIFLDHRVGPGKAVHHAGILQIGAGLQDQTPEIAAQAGARPDITTGTDDDVADQHGTGMDIGGRIDDRNDAIDGIDSQGWHRNTLRRMAMLYYRTDFK
ncbi:hypothetical protein SDC9_199994 [bioreactor metagenome]|uniref:Uncharacterized protein n=1 Tax=bioreactor metagenome TaxID=1076179 RepID=A0A645IM18_9ZZZZ